MNGVCPVCVDGYLIEYIFKNQVEYKDCWEEIDLHYSVCDNCKSEITDHSQIKINKQNMIDFKNRIDKLTLE